MNRRQLLASLTVGAGALAGCQGRQGSTGSPTQTRTRTPGADSNPGATTPTSGSAPEVTPFDLASLGTPATICSESIREDSGIYAVTEPRFDSDWSGYDVERTYFGEQINHLPDEQTVIGLTDGDRARAYPLEILWHHEIVNDDFGAPVMVTFCPLCRSGLVAERVVDGEVTNFAVSGLLWQAPREYEAGSEANGNVFGTSLEGGEDLSVRHSGNLVMYDDATRSYWSQILAKAICGPMAGTSLTIHPFSLSTWGEWRAEHPQTDVLLPPPHSGVRETNPTVTPGG